MSPGPRRTTQAARAGSTRGHHSRKEAEGDPHDVTESTGNGAQRPGRAIRGKLARATTPEE